jgi:hypothetical protein
MMLGFDATPGFGEGVTPSHRMSQEAELLFARLACDPHANAQ